MQKEKKRRRSTHFTPHKGKKKKKSLVFRRLPKHTQGLPKVKKQRGRKSKNALLNRGLNSKSSSSLSANQNFLSTSSGQVTTVKAAPGRPRLKQTTLQFKPLGVSSASKAIHKSH